MVLLQLLLRGMSRRRTSGVVFAVLLTWAPWCAGQVLLKGRVCDESDAPVGQARITVQPDKAAGEPLRAVADPAGGFSLVLPAPGDYLVNVQREGYFELRNYRLRLDSNRELTLVLSPLREVFQTLDVHGTPSPAGLDQTALEERLSGTEVNDVPIPASHSLRNAMRLMPGVVQDPTAALHFAGAAENQVDYTLNDFHLGDPITGRFNTRLAVEGIRSLEFQAGRYPAEFGKGAAGVLAIHTDTGADQFRYTATNFVPGLGTQHGMHLGNWTPRFGVSGPIWRGRAWFADNFSAEYDQAFINGLPAGQDHRSGWSGSNLLHNQVNLTPGQILFADFLVNLDTRNRAGLGPLDPVSTTSTLRSREYFASLKDQMYFGHGALAEFGYAHSGFFDRQIPQGQGLYILSPSGRSGNNFVDSSQWAGRDQVLVNAFAPGFELAGAHQVKIGVDLDQVNYRGDFGRTGYEQIGLASYPQSKTVFQGSGSLRRARWEASSYAMDRWRLRRNLQVEAGIRQDWDEMVGQVAFSPRASISCAPWASGRTRLSAGYAITHDATSLALFSRPFDQSAVTTRYNPDGSAASGPLLTSYTIDNRQLKLPRYENWRAGIDQGLPHRIEASVDYLRRSGRDGFAYVNTSFPAPAMPAWQPLFGSPGLSGVYTLTNLRRDRYDAVEVTVRQRFSEQFEWMGSYVRSRAISNAVVDFNIDEPFQVLNNLEPLPWDAPHRFLGWAYLPLPRKNWAIAVLADARSGFPFSIADETGRIAGAVDSRRFPANFDLNVHVERRFTLRGYRLALRAGFNNITDHPNPSAVNNMIGSPQYLQFLGTEGRHLVLRLRVFGRSKGQS
jgi:hypothetical protein